MIRSGHTRVQQAFGEALMLGLGKKKSSSGGAFSLRVSDVVDVPLRGTMLRLRVAEGQPSMSDLGVGSRLRVRGMGGAEREVRIVAHAVTGGKPTQERLERTGELDVVVEEVSGSQEPIEIGWMASGVQD
jgi:hypothetical protein